MRFTQREIKELIISTVVLAFAFSRIINIGDFITNFLASLFILTVVFVPHELLGHKLIAQRFGCHAEYRMWKTGLIIAIIGSLFGVVFAAPGAVMIFPGIRKEFAWTIHRITSKEMALIALAGPIVNIIFGFALIGLLFASLPYAAIIYTAARISFFLALFNLLPFGPLDGAKILNYSWKLWGIGMALAAGGYLVLGII